MSNRTAIIGAIAFATIAVSLMTARAFQRTNAAPLLLHTYKLRPQFSAQLSSNIETPIAGNSKFLLSARIESQKRVRRLNYQWILPETVVAKDSAALVGAVTNIARGSAAIINIELHNLSPENSKVFLRVWSTGEDGSQSVVTQFNTANETLINEENKKIAERHNQYLIENADAPQTQE
jgi:hypothetical protein